jgi:hypothetical protein
MATSCETDLLEFVEFAQAQLANGGANLTPEEVLDLWRADHPSAHELADSVAAIQRALDQASRGEGASWEEFDSLFRERHQVPGDA